MQTTAAIDHHSSPVFAARTAVVPHVSRTSGATDALGNDLFVEEQSGWQAARTRMVEPLMYCWGQCTIYWPKPPALILNHNIDNRLLQSGMGRKRCAAYQPESIGKGIGIGMSIDTSI